MVVWLCWVYDMVANLAPLRNRLGRQDAGSLLHAEKWMHMDPEAAMDHWMSHHHTLAVWVANYYDNAHFVVTLTLVAVLWWKWPDRYRPLRNSLVLLNVFGMVVYWFVPTAPPRLYDPSVYLDVVARTHAFGSWHSGTLATAANELAAMPSLHIGWACWSALALRRVLPRRWWADLVWLYPVATALAVLSTGNHFVLDVLAGAADFAIATLIADRLHGWWTSRHRGRPVVDEAQRLLDEPTMIPSASRLRRRSPRSTIAPTPGTRGKPPRSRPSLGSEPTGGRPAPTTSPPPATARPIAPPPPPALPQRTTRPARS